MKLYMRDKRQLKIKPVRLNGSPQLSVISLLPASVVLQLKMSRGQQLSKVDKRSP